MNAWARRGGLTVVVIAALAAGRAVTEAMPTDAGALKGAAQPFVVTGAVGQTAHLRYADVTVDGVRPALGIAGAYGPNTTPGHFVVVDLTVRAVDRPLVLTGYSLLATDGRRFSVDRRWSHGEIPTGVRWHQTAVFEVPADAIQGATLEIAKGADWWAQRRDHVLHVDLGLDAAKAREFAANRDVIATPSDGFAAPETTPVGEMPDA